MTAGIIGSVGLIETLTPFSVQPEPSATHFSPISPGVWPIDSLRVQWNYFPDYCCVYGPQPQQYPL
jgi:hypothetical protein